MLKRLPQPQALVQVYAVIAVLLSAWTISAFLWKLSAWLLFLNLGEIFTIFSYAMLSNLLESLIIFLVLLALCILLPPNILRDHFVVRGTILVVGIIGSLMTFVGLRMQIGIEHGSAFLLGFLSVALVTVLLLSLSRRSRFVRSIHSVVFWFSDHLIVFLFILLPLYVILSAYVIFRNIV